MQPDKDVMGSTPRLDQGILSSSPKTETACLPACLPGEGGGRLVNNLVNGNHHPDAR